MVLCRCLRQYKTSYSESLFNQTYMENNYKLFRWKILVTAEFLVKFDYQICLLVIMDKKKVLKKSRQLKNVIFIIASVLPSYILF